MSLLDGGVQIRLLASASGQGLSPLREVARSVNESQDLYSGVEHFVDHPVLTNKQLPNVGLL